MEYAAGQYNDPRFQLGKHEWPALLRLLDDNNSIPSKYSIIKAYPNPFNPSLNIEITVDQRSHLKVDIFSYNGNYISTIFDQISDIRIQKFEWNPNNLPSGIYFVSSYNNGKRNYKKVTYIK